MSRRRVTQRQARAHHRPAPGSGNRLVSVHGNTYEVHDIPEGGQKIFRLELGLVAGDQERERRRRQIERGVLRVTEVGHD